MKTLACAWCISSAFGDRSFTWPYLGLILAPFLVLAAVGTALAWQAGIRPRTIGARLADRLRGRRAGDDQRLASHNDPLPHKETT